MRIKKFNESSNHGYEIIVNYDSGDSDTTDHGQEDSLSLEWNNHSIVKENVDRIEDHYKFYNDLNGFGGRLSGKYGDQKWNEQRKIHEENSQKDWAIVEWKIYSESRKQVVSPEYKKKFPEDCSKIPFVSEVSLKIKSDEGKFITQSAYWCGHFEKLNWVEVRSKSPNYRKSFN